MAAELSRLADLSTVVPIPESEVVALEEVIGAPLPDEFRSFLLRLGQGISPGRLLDLHGSWKRLDGSVGTSRRNPRSPPTRGNRSR